MTTNHVPRANIVLTAQVIIRPTLKTVQSGSQKKSLKNSNQRELSRMLTPEKLITHFKNNSTSAQAYANKLKITRRSIETQAILSFEMMACRLKQLLIFQTQVSSQDQKLP